MKHYKKDCGFVEGRRGGGSCLGAGWLPMRKEIAWNVGMHSHPKCLNKLAVNGAGDFNQECRPPRERVTSKCDRRYESHTGTFLTNEDELVQK